MRWSVTTGLKEADSFSRCSLSLPLLHRPAGLCDLVSFVLLIFLRRFTHVSLYAQAATSGWCHWKRSRAAMRYVVPPIILPLLYFTCFWIILAYLHWLLMLTQFVGLELRTVLPEMCGTSPTRTWP